MANYSKRSRREFLTTVTTAGAAMMLNPLVAWTIDQVDPRVAAIVAATIGIDTHNHIDVPLTAAEVPGPNIDLAREMRRSGLSAICMTFPLDYQKISQPGEFYDRFLNALASMDKQLENNNMQRSLNLADLRAAHDRHQPTVVQSVEGAHFLEGHLERVEIAYKRGLRHFGLLHDSDASVPLGDVYTNPPRWGGLTTFGSDVIKECNRLGILVDLAHASTDTVAAALKVVAHPPMISHTSPDWRLGHDPHFAQMMRPRLISKEEAKVIADAGGVVGVWVHFADTPLEYAQNIRALVDVIGIDHVCIGTDTKLTPGRPPRPGGNDRTNQAWQDQKMGFYYAVVDAMLKTGFTADEIGKVGGGNFCRLFDASTAGHS
jgi:membrane dipeptidase